MLNEIEWNKISNILLELYTIDNIDLLSQKSMKVLHMLIPYSKGYFILLDDDQNINKDKSHFVGMDSKKINEYIEIYYDKDYLKYLYECSSETVVYKDTNILEDKVRKQTDIYQNFLCLLIFIMDVELSLLEIIALLVSLVSSKMRMQVILQIRIYILNVLKRHIENMVYNVTQISRAKIAVDKSLNEFSIKYGLTVRETEIVKLLNKGYSNQEIANKFVISLSTVKKHIYNIYNKTSVSSRSQLIALLFKTER